MDSLEEVRTVIDAIEDAVCDKIFTCGFAAGRHIAVEIYSTDPQRTRPIIQSTLDKEFPTQKFRLMMYREKN